MHTTTLYKLLACTSLLVYGKVAHDIAQDIAVDAPESAKQDKSTHRVSTDNRKVIDNITINLLKRKHAFLGELVSNALDALKRLCVLTCDPNADTGRDIEISIYTTEDNTRVFTIRDYGCGMNKDALLSKLTRIGSSSNTAENKEEGFIGNFGWGFFSIFAEADRARITTRSYNENVTNTMLLDPSEETFDIHQSSGESFDHGTLISLDLKKDISLTEKDVADWVSHNLINDSRFNNFNIKIMKSSVEIQNEREAEENRVRNKRTSLEEKREKATKEKNDEMEKLEKAEEDFQAHSASLNSKSEVNEDTTKEDTEDAVLTEDEKKEGEDATNEKKENEKECEKKEGVEFVDRRDEILKKISKLEEDIKKYDDELENLTEQEISPERVLDLCPWILTPEFEDLKKVYETRYSKKNLKIAEKHKFTIRQSGGFTTLPVDFETLVFIPTIEENMFAAQEDKIEKGELELFVQGSKINVSLKSEFLSPFTFIVKSNQAKLSSTREEFLDNKETVEKIKNALIKIVCDTLLAKMTDLEIHKYAKIIKAGYFDLKKQEADEEKSRDGVFKKTGTKSTLEKVCNVLTFHFDSGVTSLKKFVDIIEKANEINKKKKEKVESKENIKEDTINEEVVNKDEDIKEDETIKEEDIKEDELKEETNEEVKEDTNEEVKSEEEDTKVKKEEEETKYGFSDAIYFTTISQSLLKNITNPLLDGIDIPYLILDDIHDEQILGSMRDYSGLKIKNINTKSFEHKPEIVGKEKLKYEPLLEFIKETLGTYISEVVISRRLKSLPFSILSHENAMSQGLRSVIGENKLDSNPFRSMFDPKPRLEVNVDSDVIIKIADILSTLKVKENTNSDDTDNTENKKDDKKKESKIVYDESENEKLENLRNGVKSMFVGTSIACRVDLYEKGSGVLDLLNMGRSFVGVEKMAETAKNSQNDMFRGMDMNMFGNGASPMGNMDFGGEGADEGMDMGADEDKEDDNEEEDMESEDKESGESDEEVEAPVFDDAEKEAEKDESPRDEL